MDFSKFSDPDFDVKSWINKALDVSKSSADREQQAARLLMKLQLLIGEVHKSLEECNAQANVLMPTVIREAETIRREVALLQNTMRSARHDVTRVERETSEVMEKLLLLHAAKERMEDAEKTLRESEKWSTLMEDVHSVFESGSAELIGDRLVDLQRSLDIVGSKAPKAEEASNDLELLKDRFLAMISPSIVRSLNNRDTETLQHFAKLFNDLQRPGTLPNLYYQCMKIDLQGVWVRINREYQQTHANNENMFEMIVCEVLSDINNAWQGQLTWVMSAFGGLSKYEAYQIVSKGYALALQNLQPSFDSVVTNGVEAHSSPMKALCNLKSRIDEFKSLFIDNGADEILIFEFYKPFVSAFKNYRQLEQSGFLTKFNMHSIEPSPNNRLTADFVKKFRRAVESLFKTEAQAAAERCASLSGGVALPALATALRTLFSNFLSKANKAIESLMQLYDPANLGNKDRKESIEKDIWDTFQHVLTLLEVCGLMLSTYDQLDDRLQSQLKRLKHIVDESALSDKNASGDGDSQRIDKDHHRLHLSSLETMLFKDESMKSAVVELILKVGVAGDDDNVDIDRMQDVAILSDIRQKLVRFTEKCHRFALAVLMMPVQRLFVDLPRLTIWEQQGLFVGESLSHNLPSYALSPQEYVTYIGQYLMTLANYLEPFMTGSDEEKSWLLLMSLRYANLPYTSFLPISGGTGADNAAVEKGGGDWALRLWLVAVGHSIMHGYVQAIVSIKHMNTSAAKQLHTDLEYFCNALDDLGLRPIDDLSYLKALTSATDKQTFDNIVANDIPNEKADLVAALKEIRGFK